MTAYLVSLIMRCLVHVGPWFVFRQLLVPIGFWKLSRGTTGIASFPRAKLSNICCLKLISLSHSDVG
jgi:hypothetical protein